MTLDTSRADLHSATEKPVSRRALREQRERELHGSAALAPVANENTLVNSTTGFLGLGGYSAVIDEIAPRDTSTTSVLASPEHREDKQDLRRRERSERERPFRRSLRDDSARIERATKRAAVTRDIPGAPAQPSKTVIEPVAGSSFRRAQAAKAEQKPGSRRSFAKKAFAGTAMLFALGIGVATTLPANAYFALPGHDPAATSVTTEAASAKSESQQVTANAAPVEVVRDGYASSARSSLATAGMKTAMTFVNNPASPIQWPFPVGVPISDGFGHRESPGGIGSTNHKGVDFAPGGGTPIGAIADGVVKLTHTYDSGGLGVYVTVDHVINGEKVTSVYGHMKTGSISVSEGQAVKVGETLGLVGSTGTSTGNHLHLEIHVNGTPVDPFAWLTEHVKA